MKEIKRYDYKLDPPELQIGHNSKSFQECLDGQYAKHEVLEAMQKRIEELEGDLLEMCKALSNTVNFGSISEFDDEYKKAESIIDKFDN